jgi:hypothetical protein
MASYGVAGVASHGIFNTFTTSPPSARSGSSCPLMTQRPSQPPLAPRSRKKYSLRRGRVVTVTKLPRAGACVLLPRLLWLQMNLSCR